jgi:hypothetical protein
MSNIIKFRDGLKDAFEALKKFIEDNKEAHPEGLEYQRQIEAALEKAGDNPNNRLVTIQELMKDKQRELKEQLEQLRNEMIKMKGAMETVAKIKKEEESKQ